MPAKSPPQGLLLNKILRELGRAILAQRKLLKISSIATAEAAGISRMTLNRIEKGEASVTLGAYLNVISVLGLSIVLVDQSTPSKMNREKMVELPKKIRLADYPQLKKIAWQLNDTKELSPKEALALYERNWRHIDLNEMEKKERALIQALVAEIGMGRLLV
jgi:transcriptional regulator with XRE-family HTH domain